MFAPIDVRKFSGSSGVSIAPFTMWTAVWLPACGALEAEDGYPPSIFGMKKISQPGRTG